MHIGNTSILFYPHASKRGGNIILFGRMFTKKVKRSNRVGKATGWLLMGGGLGSKI